MQTRFEFAIFPGEVDLHILSDSDATHLRHSKMPHRVADSVTLWIEHRGLWHHDDFHFHRLTIFAAHRGTSRIRNSCFPDNVFGTFIFTQAEENWLAQFSVTRPFSEFNLANEDRIDPCAFAHFRRRDSLHPFSILFQGEVYKRAVVALFSSEFIV